jgi:uncharacterized protein Smg (DUF494 family)
MFERIIEIIVYLLSELREKNDMSEIDLSKLKQLGYSNSEISAAFSWIVDRVEFSDELFKGDLFPSNVSFRVIQGAEEDLFTRDAWGEMIQYQMLGLIDNEQIETMIEKAMVSGTNGIDKGAIRQYVANYLRNPDARSKFGSRFMLDGNETIN